MCIPFKILDSFFDGLALRVKLLTQGITTGRLNVLKPIKTGKKRILAFFLRFKLLFVDNSLKPICKPSRDQSTQKRTADTSIE